MHCASLGEFEQGRPVLEAIRERYPAHRILLTFFSPSGYEHQKHYTGADMVDYLPMDGPRNAKRFIELANPSLVIFVKYEFWFYYLKKLHYRRIPLLLISAYFRPEMSFFRWYGALARKMLTRFDRIFVQDAGSRELLAGIGIRENVEIGGDTRFDRVLSLSQEITPIEPLEAFLTPNKVLVVGSSWAADEELWADQLEWCKQQGIRLLIVPHEVDAASTLETLRRFPTAQCYSEIEGGAPLKSDILVVDRVGILAKLYRYGWVNYVGGGLDSGGVHNVLEAAVHGRPVITGPRVEKYREAQELAMVNGSATLPETNIASALRDLLEKWHSEPSIVENMGRSAGEFVRERTGAVDRILRYIQEKRLLTN